jgi:hypothetical protein
MQVMAIAIKCDNMLVGGSKVLRTDRTEFTLEAHCNIFD